MFHRFMVFAGQTMFPRLRCEIAKSYFNLKAVLSLNIFSTTNWKLKQGTYTQTANNFLAVVLTSILFKPFNFWTKHPYSLQMLIFSS